jgi:16S rRNA U516 pseudouridylate synthase RsuA-like enzyme
VAVNGRTARLGQRVDAATDEIALDGSKVVLEERTLLYLLHKPYGVVTTADDPRGRPTVMDLIDAPGRVWPVGRLDFDSEGALLMTNDGDLTQRLTHPRHAVPKTYVVTVRVPGGAAREGRHRPAYAGSVAPGGLAEARARRDAGALPDRRALSPPRAGISASRETGAEASEVDKSSNEHVA